MDPVSDEDLANELEYLEKKERDCLSRNECLSEIEYAKYFAGLLCKTNMIPAADLWNRMPPKIKRTFLDIPQLRRVFLNMRSGDTVGIYRHLKEYNWSRRLQKYVPKITDAIRRFYLRILSVSQPYVEFAHFLTIMDYYESEAEAKIRELGWKFIGDKVYTKPPPSLPLRYGDYMKKIDIFLSGTSDPAALEKEGTRSYGGTSSLIGTPRVPAALQKRETVTYGTSSSTGMPRVPAVLKKKETAAYGTSLSTGTPRVPAILKKKETDAYGTSSSTATPHGPVVLKKKRTLASGTSSSTGSAEWKRNRKSPKWWEADLIHYR